MDNKVADDIIVKHSHGIDDEQSGEIGNKIFGQGQVVHGFHHLSGDIRSNAKTDNVAETGF